ncbi:GGDEF domain-containing protein [Flavisphingomonas formosensis]|uniref:GGDEF domain-containing protein n=1 Tax=Flavisphingomonas formosensis TaxID=861534 RepID=UPI0012F70A58|nr:GGDEF domain-containing protein [Sphingomonas formosensis]
MSWAIGFLCGAGGFSLSMLSGHVPDAVIAIASDMIFSVSFFFYGQALVDRLGGPVFLRSRLAICGLSLLLSLWSVLYLRDLHAELALNDFCCGLMALLPLIAMRKHLHRAIDKALFAVTALVVADSLGRASTVLLTAPADIDGFASSEYAFVMQLTASVLAVLFALTALAAVGLDVVARYRQEASTDPLSALLNRRGFEDAVAGFRVGDPAAGSVVTCDIDRFKRINDRFGHAVGDRVIMALAQTIRAALPPGGIAARFGGEEFVIYLPAMGAAEAKLFADEVRTGFSEQDWGSAGIDGVLTASFGLSGTQVTDFSIHDAIARADEALYDAKRAGRNRVSVKLALISPESGHAGRAETKRITPQAG